MKSGWKSLQTAERKLKGSSQKWVPSQQANVSPAETQGWSRSQEVWKNGLKGMKGWYLHTRYTGPPSTLGIVIHDAPPWTGEKASLGPTHTPQTSRELAGLCREDGGAGQRSDSGPHACVVTILLTEIPPQSPSILF